MNLEDLILSEISQKDKYRSIFLMWVNLKHKKKTKQKHKQTHKSREQTGGCQRIFKRDGAKDKISEGD